LHKVLAVDYCRASCGDLAASAFYTFQKMRRNNYNPSGLHIASDGVLRDKYGRAFAIDEGEMKRRRKDRVNPARSAAMPIRKEKQ
jgi:hypothetical protein